MKEHFPDKEILADMKIMDAGYYEAEEALKAGADYVTVLGVTDNLTIQGCKEAAEKYGKEIVVDMICVENMEERIAKLEETRCTWTRCSYRHRSAGSQAERLWTI